MRNKDGEKKKKRKIKIDSSGVTGQGKRKRNKKDVGGQGNRWNQTEGADKGCSEAGEKRKGEKDVEGGWVAINLWR